MPLIKDLKNVKDEEITLLDVKRAEEIIERANKLLGRATTKEIHHWNGWQYINVQPIYTPATPVYPSYTNPNAVWCSTQGGSASTGIGSSNLNTSITEVCAGLLSS